MTEQWRSPDMSLTDLRDYVQDRLAESGLNAYEAQHMLAIFELRVRLDEKFATLEEEAASAKGLTEEVKEHITAVRESLEARGAYQSPSEAVAKALREWGPGKQVSNGD